MTTQRQGRDIQGCSLKRNDESDDGSSSENNHPSPVQEPAETTVDNTAPKDSDGRNSLHTRNILCIRSDLHALHIKLLLAELSIKKDETTEKLRSEITASSKEVGELLEQVDCRPPLELGERNKFLKRAYEVLKFELTIDDVLHDLKETST